MSALTDVALGAGAKIGRYFNIVSVVPSLIFVIYVAGLLKAGAWEGSFSPARAGAAIGTPDAASIAVLVTLAIGLGIVLHPLQFPITQVLEGYWGTTAVANGLMEARIRHYRTTALRLIDKAEEHEAALTSTALATQRTEVAESMRRLSGPKLWAAVQQIANTAAGDTLLPHIVRQDSARRALGAYPSSVRRIRPTRLGNALRSYEDLAGVQYSLKPIPIATHLSLVAEPDHVAYQADARQQMDLSVRVCFLAVLATGVTSVLLASHGAWVLLALGPYLVAYLAYRGAVSASHAYGTAVATVLDLNRFRLYEHLHLPLPDTLQSEQEQNQALLEVLRGGTSKLAYRHPI